MEKKENCNDPSKGTSWGPLVLYLEGISPIMMTDTDHCPRCPNWIIPLTREV